VVAASGANIAAVAVERIVNRVDLSDARLLMLSQSFADFGEKTRLLMALVGERCLTYPVFDRPQTLNRDYYDRLPPRAVLEAYNALGLAARDGIAYLDCVQECMGVLRLPMCQYRDAAETAPARRFPRKRSILRRQIGYGTGIVAREAVYVAPREMCWPWRDIDWCTARCRKRSTRSCRSTSPRFRRIRSTGCLCGTSVWTADT